MEPESPPENKAFYCGGPAGIVSQQGHVYSKRELMPLMSVYYVKLLENYRNMYLHIARLLSVVGRMAEAIQDMIVFIFSC